MKPEKYIAFEFCRDNIKSCKTWKHTIGAGNLISNFRLMFGDDILTNFLRNELIEQILKMK